jgi:hypothetical protein
MPGASTEVSDTPAQDPAYRPTLGRSAALLEPFFSSSGCRPVSMTSAPFWHAAGSIQGVKVL